MTAIVVTLSMIAACTGLGAAALAPLGVARRSGRAAFVLWSFVCGFGLLGWLVFCLGAANMLQGLPLAVLLGLGALGLAVAVRVPVRDADGAARRALDAIEWTIVALIVAAMSLDLLEGLSPPADADTLAYLFALPKAFLSEGGLFFVHRAVDGSIPLLIQMTYVPALALGGETALTLWTMVTGWMAPAALYLICRHFIDRRWSLISALILLTTPAVLYGAGSGQIEVRMSLFVLFCVMIIADGWDRFDLGHAIAIGLAAGFLMGSKYTGLLLAASVAPAVLLVERRFRPLLLAAAVGVLAGGQWYLWNWIHTGDPVYPMLFGLVEYRDGVAWDTTHANAISSMFANDVAVPNNFLWLLGYPLYAMLSGNETFEASRTGFGPFLLFIAPFAAMGAWRLRHRIPNSPLTGAALIAVAFYLLWFFLGPSQRVRHFVPVYPLLILCMMAASHRWAAVSRQFRPLAVAAAVTLVIQFAGQGVFSVNYLRHHVSGESRDAFLERNVSLYAPARWINANLGPDGRVLIPFRQLVYHIDKRVFYAHPDVEPRVDTSEAATDPSRLFRQMRNQNVSHALVRERSDVAGAQAAHGLAMWPLLVSARCATPVARIGADSIRSRSLGLIQARQTLVVLKLTEDTCELA